MDLAAVEQQTLLTASTSSPYFDLFIKFIPKYDASQISEKRTYIWFLIGFNATFYQIDVLELIRMKQLSDPNDSHFFFYKQKWYWKEAQELDFGSCCSWEEESCIVKANNKVPAHCCFTRFRLLSFHRGVRVIWG